MTPADVLPFVPSVGSWGLVAWIVFRAIRWLVERSDTLTEASIRRLTDDLERCRTRTIQLEELWDVHREHCPLLTFPAPPEE